MARSSLFPRPFVLLLLSLLLSVAVIAGCVAPVVPAAETSSAENEVESTAAATAPEAGAPTEMLEAIPESSDDGEAESDAEAEEVATAPVMGVLQEYDVPAGSHPHDVAPAEDGGIWYTAQHSQALGWLDPATGETRHIDLGNGSAPHGVIVGPDGAPWITDGGLDAIVRVDPATDEVIVYKLPAERWGANLNTAVFDNEGVLWFTGQSGIYGRLDPSSGEMQVWGAPRGRGPYGITATPDGQVYYASLAGSHIAHIDPATGEATPIDSPTPGQGARRVWTDSTGRIWVSEYVAGQVGLYDPATGAWQEWKLPGDFPAPYPIYVDENDKVWMSDFATNSLVMFDPTTEEFVTYPLPSAGASVRQILGRPGEIWGAESGTDKLVVVRMP